MQFRFDRRAVAAGLFVGASIFTMLGYVVLYVVEVLRPSVAFDGRVLAATAVGGLVLASIRFCAP